MLDGQGSVQAAMHMASYESNENSMPESDDIDLLMMQGNAGIYSPVNKRDEVKAEIRNLHLKAMREEVESPHFMNANPMEHLSSQGTLTFRAPKGALKKHADQNSA